MNNKFNQNDSAALEKYKGSKVYIAFSCAFTLWLISIIFNTNGFNFQIPEKAWMGIALGVIVTAIQLLMSDVDPMDEPVLFILCLVSYGYSIYLDVIGIVEAMQIKLAWSSSLIFPVALAAFIEILPERLVIKALKMKTGKKLFNFGSKPNKHQEKPKFSPIPFKPQVYNNPMDERNPKLELMREELRRENIQKSRMTT